MNEEINRTLHYLRHNLTTLKTDLAKPQQQSTCGQRLENCVALLEMLERQISQTNA